MGQRGARQQCEARLSEAVFVVWECVLCGFVYDEAAGAPDEGLAPGTRWADVPEDWSCPDCGAGKADFEMRPRG